MAGYWGQRYSHDLIELGLSNERSTCTYVASNITDYHRSKARQHALVLRPVLVGIPWDRCVRVLTDGRIPGLAG